MKTRSIFIVGLLNSALLFGACSDVASRDRRALSRLTDGGDPQLGKEAIRNYGCQTCHTIRGVPGARALVGPDLTGLRERAYLAGQLPNTPENLIHWVQHPHSVNPKTVMPEMNVGDEDARNIAAYLYSLPAPSP
jgi:cytochrome c